ncbi:MAG: hypothetical protein Q7S57_06390 [bacterium]|nr:hypothetical protein [bacterium]
MTTTKLTAEELKALMIRDTYLRRGNLDKALDCNPKNQPIPADLLVMCGNAAAKIGRLDDAIEAYKKANALEKLLDLGKICAVGIAGPENYERHQLARICFGVCNATDQQLSLGRKYLLYLKALNISSDCSRYFGLAYSLLASAKTYAEQEQVELGDVSRRFLQFETAINCYMDAKAIAKLNELGNGLLEMQNDNGDTMPTQYALYCFKASGNHEKALECADWFVRRGKNTRTAHQIRIGLDVYKELAVTLPEALVLEVLDALADDGDTRIFKQVAGMFADHRINEQQRKPAKTARPRRPRTKKRD